MEEVPADTNATAGNKTRKSQGALNLIGRERQETK